MTKDWRYLDIADLLLIAEELLGIDAEVLANKHVVERAESALHTPRIGFAAWDVYESVELKAAVLCVRVALNRPLPDGNKRTAFISVIEFLHRNGYRWLPHPDDPDATAALIENVAAAKVSVEALAWIIGSRIEPLP